MKRYRILCKEITGVKSKILTNGNEYAENEFVSGCIDEYVKLKHIEEVVESAISDDAKVDSKKK